MSVNRPSIKDLFKVLAEGDCRSGRRDLSLDRNLSLDRAVRCHTDATTLSNTVVNTQRTSTTHNGLLSATGIAASDHRRAASRVWLVGVKIQKSVPVVRFSNLAPPRDTVISQRRSTDDVCTTFLRAPLRTRSLNTDPCPSNPHAVHTSHTPHATPRPRCASPRSSQLAPIMTTPLQQQQWLPTGSLVVYSTLPTTRIDPVYLIVASRPLALTIGVVRVM